MSALILALPAGAVVGLALGGLGGGGSMLTVPALIYLLGFSPAQATTAGLLIVAATSLTGLLAHARAGRVRWRSGLLFAAAGLPVAALFGLASAQLPGALLTGAFAALAGFAAWRMLSPRPQAPPTGATVTRPARAAGVGAALGGATGLLGVGGGFLVVPALTSALAFPMAEAVGTSLLVITANSAAALVPRLGAADGLHWAVLAPFTATAVLAAWDAKRLSDRFSGRTLQRAFAVTLMAVAALMLGSLLA